MRRISAYRARRTVSCVAVVVAVISFLPELIGEMQTLGSHGVISVCVQQSPRPQLRLR